MNQINPKSFKEAISDAKTILKKQTSSWLGKKVYLGYHNNKGWKVYELGLLDRFLRFSNLNYQHTHFKNVVKDFEKIDTLTEEDTLLVSDSHFTKKMPTLSTKLQKICTQKIKEIGLQLSGVITQDSKNESTHPSEEITLSESDASSSLEIDIPPSQTHKPLIEEREFSVMITFPETPEGMLTHQLWQTIKTAKKVNQGWENALPHIAEASKKFELSKEIIDEVQEKYLDNDSSLMSAPKAKAGVKANFIVIPNDLPIVIRIDAEKHGNRLEKAEQAHIICKMNQFTHLTTPKMQQLGNFIIEEKIGTEKNSSESFHFYMKNSDRFDQAVEEFTSFLCLSELKDLAGNTKMQDLFPDSEALLPRYDNALLYEENGQYKIGLIDFDTFKLRNKKPSKDDIHGAVKTALHLFPNNAEVTIKKGYEILEKYGESPIPSFEEFQDSFKKIIHDQLKLTHFMQSRLDKYEALGISSENPSILPISETIKMNIQKKLETELSDLYLNQEKKCQVLSSYFAGYEDKKKYNQEQELKLGNYTEEEWKTACEVFCHDFPSILEIYQKRIEKEIKRNIKKDYPFMENPIIPKKQLATYRTMSGYTEFQTFRNFSESIKKFYKQKDKESATNPEKFGPKEATNPAQLLRSSGVFPVIRKTVLTELVEAGIIHGFTQEALFC